ncbi:hypothetical protein Q8A67_018893 [Cirrhinus molitorella]|uniref:Uncharacterized protein n=1 Tax=Cirrhinus molitorella TaxID=172907 RepID=A0AA88TR74_9TELE|nr:hypothetical protein Q8A67_018893 [Cirrhinus molitorella]
MLLIPFPRSRPSSRLNSSGFYTTTPRDVVPFTASSCPAAPGLQSAVASTTEDRHGTHHTARALNRALDITAFTSSPDLQQEQSQCNYKLKPVLMLVDLLSLQASADQCSAFRLTVHDGNLFVCPSQAAEV